jgi:ABC-type branched-subunit amino acid transport system permease subunit
MLIYFILAQSYNLVLGYTGMVHVGHIGFMAIGAYTSALLTLNGAPFFVGLFGGLLVAGFVGLILGIPTVRLKNDYLVAVTLGMGEIIRLFLLNERQWTGGSFGLTQIKRPELFGFVFQNNFHLFLLLLFITTVVLALIWKLIHSPFGKILESIREDEVAAKSLGKPVELRKLQILVIGAAFAGLAGALYAHTLQFIDPDTFGIHRMIFIFLLVVFGGAGKFWGPIVGTVILYNLAEGTRFLPIAPSALGPLRWIIFSVVLVIIIILKPKGILGDKLIRKKL